MNTPSSIISPPIHLIGKDPISLLIDEGNSLFLDHRANERSPLQISRDKDGNFTCPGWSSSELIVGEVIYPAVGKKRVKVEFTDPQQGMITISTEEASEDDEDRIIAVLNAVVGTLRQEIGELLVKTMQIVKGNAAQVKLSSPEEALVIMDENGLFVGRITVDENGKVIPGVCTISYTKHDEQAVLQINNVRDTPLKIALVPLHITRGKEYAIRSLHADPDFGRHVIVNNCDGTLAFFGLFGTTNIGGRNQEGGENEDGIYLNPEKRIIAGVDGMGGHENGSLAAGFALASIHSDVGQDIPLKDIAIRACRYLSEQFAKRGRTAWRAFPGCTLGFAQERKDAQGAKHVEGFTVGDYKALIIDVTNGKICFESKDQVPEFPSKRGEISNCILPISDPSGTMMQEPNYFQHNLISGHQYLVLLFSDGISDQVHLGYILEMAKIHKENTAQVIADLWSTRGDDNISIVQMVCNA